MLAEELRHAQNRAAVQAVQRKARQEARSLAKPTTSNTSTEPDPELSLVTATMEAPQYAKIIDSIPIFSGEPKENVSDWLDIVTLKFDIIGYDALQKRRFIPQYLAGKALKWHLAHREDLASWADYTTAISAAFPRFLPTSRDMNLQMLKTRKQLNNESFY